MDELRTKQTMANEEPKKGYESLMAAYCHTAETWPGYEKEGKAKVEWVLARAQQYADASGVDRETVLAAWEKDRDYWFMSYYQESKQPDLSRTDGKPVMMEDDWLAKGRRLYGDNRLDWRYKCPMCGHVQTPREFREKGIDPNQAITCCASRYGLGGKEDCKWTTGGAFRIGGIYVVTKEFYPALAFAFADEEKED